METLFDAMRIDVLAASRLLKEDFDSLDVDAYRKVINILQDANKHLLRCGLEFNDDDISDICIIAM